MRRALVIACLLAAGCGSGAPLPPVAGPDATETRTAAELADGTPVTIDRTQRRLRVGDETVAAGFGPTQVTVGDDDRIYVTDTAGGSILLFRHEPELEIVRRAALPGRPSATTLDPERGKLWVAVTGRDEVVQLSADGAPRVQRRFRTVRRPNAIAVDARRGKVTVRGAGGERQMFDGYLD